jgi:hypothetical protein
MRYFYLLFIFILAGCNLLRASEIATSDFLPDKKLLTESRNRAPFHGYWVFDSNQFDQLKLKLPEIYIAEVNYAVALEKSARKNLSSIEFIDLEEEFQELSRYFEAKLKLVFTEHFGASKIIVDKNSRASLNYRLAFTEIVPTDVAINATGTFLGFVAPGGGLLKEFGKGSLAFEGYVSQEDLVLEVYEQFKDRETHKVSPFSIKDYQRYAHHRVIMDEWAMQLAGLYGSSSLERIADGNIVQLSPF